MARTDVNWRQDRFESIRPHHDRVNRRHPHRFSPLVLVRQAIQLGIPFDVIPAEYWLLTTDREGYSVAVIACPCGDTPVVDAGGIEQCPCERAYFFTGDDVSVLNSPKARPEVDAAA